MAKASTKPASSVSQIILTKNFLICDLVSSGVDPYAGRKKITEEARIREDVKRDLLHDLKQMGWKGPGGSGGSQTKKEKPKKEKKKKGEHSGDAKVAKLCAQHNSAAGCSNSSCTKEHRCNKRAGDFVCGSTKHTSSSCDHPKFK